MLSTTMKSFNHHEDHGTEKNALPCGPCLYPISSNSQQGCYDLFFECLSTRGHVLLALVMDHGHQLGCREGEGSLFSRSHLQTSIDA